MTTKKLTFRQKILVAGTLFGMFFGAGNLIFPVHLGQMAGRNAVVAMIGFIITAVGIPIFGVAAIGITHSDGLQTLSGKVGKGYGIFFTCLLYLTIGPLFAIPRCATVSFTTGITPLLGADSPEWLYLLVFSAAFFAFVLFFSLRPGKITLWIGKIINPLFLFFFAVLIIAALLSPGAAISSVEPTEAYQNGSFFPSLIEGYGTMDAIADVTAVCLLMNRLAPDEVVVSPIHVGSGQVRCAHGILPVPAPATAFILRDVPIYGGTVQGELCTPTGAALLRHFATRFGAMPPMRVQAIGYGMGKKDFEAANCVRAMLGESGSAGDTVTELSCNVDDMTGEAVGFALEELLAAGALEAFTVPVGMKKSRPGVMLCVLCREQDSERIAGLMLRHTTSIGVRAHSCRRYVLTRRIETVQTPYGEVRCKRSEGYGASRVKYEYDDLAHIARETGRTLDEVRSELTH